jgi:translation elongation factor EF-G
MATVNLGSPARVGAGKTTITGRILCAAGPSGPVAPLRLSTLDSKLLETPRHDGFGAGARSPRAPGGAATPGAGVR